MDNLTAVLQRAERGEELTDEEIAGLLDLTAPEERGEMFAAARRQRAIYFGQKIFLYGFVYFSTYCHNGCNFCFFRQANGESPRYRKSRAEILEIATALQKSGVHLLDLTMGEDPYYLDRGAAGEAELVDTVRAAKEATGLPLMVSPGVVSEQLLGQLRDAGADWYACYQETHTPSLYERLRPDQPYERRWNSKRAARRQGLLTEEGLLVGIGETTADIVHSLRQMQETGFEQVRTMTFVPQAGTPLSCRQQSTDERELNLIAVMRLLMPESLIPGSLDVEGVQGLRERLDAGANVVTSIIPPHEGLAGVANSVRDISEGYRTVAGVKPILKSCGLRAASAADYADWVAIHENGRRQAQP